jgi:hypothetical protein
VTLPQPATHNHGSHPIRPPFPSLAAVRSARGADCDRPRYQAHPHRSRRPCRAAAAFDPAFEEHARSWSVLDGYYVPTRYPNGLPDGIPADVYTRQPAQDAVALAEEAVGFVAARLTDQTSSS